MKIRKMAQSTKPIKLNETNHCLVLLLAVLIK